MDPNGQLPRGHVTFVMTDIEGSTALMRRLGDGCAALVMRHRELVGAAVRQRGGVLFGHEGDACFCAFADAAEALAACVDMQLAMAAEPWPADGAVRLRIGVHTGEAQPYGDNYIAIAVHQAARVAAAGHGGQVLVSAHTAAAAGALLAEPLRLRDLGGFRLKDFPNPEPLFQLCHPQLPEAFPPPRSLSARRHNLPRSRTSFIGRAQERTRLRQLLRDQPLVTLVGAGGVGKTRLALEVAGDLLPHFPDGVWFAELATAHDLDSAIRALGFALGITEEPGRALLDGLADFLDGKSLLLVIDNCEHLLEIAGQLVAMAMRAPGTRVLATSREPLRLSAEQLLRLVPLSTEDGGGELSEAARLFVERVQAQRAEFRLDGPTARAVTEICRRLDGVPLALELAASRARALPVTELATRLRDRLGLLSGGARDANARHQTLRATVEWSYELLSAPERLLFERLAVFADGWDLAAAEQVCVDERLPADSVLDLLTALVDKSLASYSSSFGEHRYGMLETLRDFAHEKLRATDAFSVQRRLLDWALQLAETAAPQFSGSDGSLWMSRLVLEQNNLRAALEIGHRLGAHTDVVRLTAALTHFWIKRGRLREGAQWAERAAALPAIETVSRTRLLIGYGRLLRGADNRRAEKVLWQALELGRSLRDAPLQLEALKQLTTSVRDRGDYDTAEQYLLEQLRLLPAAEDPYRRFIVETELATLPLQQGRWAEAAQRLREKVRVAERHQWQYDRARLHNSLAIALVELGDCEQAYRMASEGVALFRELGTMEGMAHALSTAGVALLHQQEFEEARRCLLEAGRISIEVGYSHLAPEALERLAVIEYALGRAVAAARFAAAADALYQDVGYEREPADQQLRTRLQAELETALGAAATAEVQAVARLQARAVLTEALGGVAPLQEAIAARATAAPPPPPASWPGEVPSATALPG